MPPHMNFFKFLVLYKRIEECKHTSRLQSEIHK